MEGYIGEIRMFGGNFAPRGWAFCDGTLYSIAEYSTVFSILGNNFGGDGQTTFGVPDLRGRIAVGTGTGNGLTEIELGEVGGSETVTMTTAQMPAHNHTATGTISFPCFSDEGNTGSPAGNILAGSEAAYSTLDPDTFIAPATTSGYTSATGSNIPFSIIQPVLATNYIICLEGYWPPRQD